MSEVFYFPYTRKQCGDVFLLAREMVHQLERERTPWERRVELSPQWPTVAETNSKLRGRYEKSMGHW